MEVQSLSASAIQVFESCEARFQAEYVERTPDIDGEAGLLGSACHEALQLWVETEQHLKPWPTMADREKALLTIWTMTYPEYFPDDSHFQAGWHMLAKWIQRTDFTGRTVLSTEVKRFFEINTSRGTLKINYIMDRVDMAPDGDIEVIDYKTVSQPVPPARLKMLIQPRLYAVAAMIEHKDLDIKGVWITYDLLRYEPVSAYFTRDDCIATWNYLKAVVERVFASDGTKEKLNPECRFCVRNLVCETLRRNVAGAGVHSLVNLEQASNRLAVLKYARSGLDDAIHDVEELVLQFARKEGILEWETDTDSLAVTAKGQRHIDPERVRKVVGEAIYAEYGKVGVTVVDQMLKDSRLTAEQKSTLKQLMTKQYGAPSVTVKPKSMFAED